MIEPQTPDERALRRKNMITLVALLALVLGIAVTPHFFREAMLPHFFKF